MVKGCDKHFHRYRVLLDRAEAMEKGSENLSFGQQTLVEGRDTLIFPLTLKKS